MSRQIDKRLKIVIQAIRDGCNDCPDHGVLCKKHIYLTFKLVINPYKWLPKFEAEIFRKKNGQK